MDTQDYNSQTRTSRNCDWSSWLAHWTKQLSLFLALLLLCPSTPLLAQTETEIPPGYQRESFQWFGKVEPGKAVRIDNEYGNIRARFGGYENKVEVLAAIQNFQADGPKLKVTPIQEEGNVIITVGYEQGQKSTEKKKFQDRVDLVVFVPKDAQLNITAKDDLIEAKGLKSDIRVSSRKGEINIKATTGRVSASSERGNITVMLETAGTKEKQTFTTLTGDITVYLWEDASMSVQATTSGEISTDFSIEITHDNFKEPSKLARATVGKGGPELLIKSKRGRVRILRLQKNFQPEPVDPKPAQAPKQQ